MLPCGVCLMMIFVYQLLWHAAHTKIVCSCCEWKKERIEPETVTNCCRRLLLQVASGKWQAEQCLAKRRMCSRLLQEANKLRHRHIVIVIGNRHPHPQVLDKWLSCGNLVQLPAMTHFMGRLFWSATCHKSSPSPSHYHTTFLIEKQLTKWRLKF